LMPVCPRQDFCDIVLEASRPRVLVCHNSSLTPRCPRGYSPPNECVLTSARHPILAGLEAPVSSFFHFAKDQFIQKNGG
jgi:hypothetical protein